MQNPLFVLVRQHDSWDCVHMTNTNRPGANMNFDSFIVVRCIGDDVEIHTVGCRASALDELLDQIEDALDACDLGGRLNLDGDIDVEIVRIGKHPDAPTGIRITNVDDHDAVAAILQETFDGVYTAN